MDGLGVEKLELPVVVAPPLEAVELVVLTCTATEGLHEVRAAGLVALKFKIVQCQTVAQVLVLAKQCVLLTGRATDQARLQFAGVFPTAGTLGDVIGRPLIGQAIQLAAGRATHAISAIRVQRSGHAGATRGVERIAQRRVDTDARVGQGTAGAPLGECSSNAGSE